MKFPSREDVAIIRSRYPEGTKIEVVDMDDPQPVPSGTIGTVVGVDDAGQLMMCWENGSSLSLVPNVDLFKVVG